METREAKEIVTAMQVLGSYVDESGRTTTYVRLPKELQREAGICMCEHCKGAMSYWDTLVVSSSKMDYTFTVHMPVISAFLRR